MTSHDSYEGLPDGPLSESGSMAAALRESEERYRALFNSLECVCLLDVEGRFLDANPAALELLGYERDELSSLSLSSLLDDAQLAVAFEALAGVVETGERKGAIEFAFRRRTGAYVHVEATGTVISRGGKPYAVLGVARNVSERKQAERALRESEGQLRQAQKMEAVGQLAGGIAHDFNNLLAAILGYCDLLLARPELAGSSALEDLEEIKHAGERASALTRQILAFSRRQTLNPTVVSLGEVVKSIVPLLGRTLGEDVQISTRVGSAAGWVEADGHQVEQVIMNLALNARDAMPSGGRLTLGVADVELSERFCRTHPGATPGRHVRLSVADTGMGMDKDTLGRVFEPFFTTKSPDKGTGLGLSVVYGTVKQSNGSIFVQSEPGRGTRVKVYLPRVEAPAPEESARATEGASTPGRETILLVEDEVSVRRLVSRILERVGYRVLAAGSAAEALRLANKAGQPIDLLVTDVVLPGGTQGDLLARQLTAFQPDLPVLYISGYPRDAIVHAGRLDQGVNFLGKPFTSEALMTTVRSLLGPGDTRNEAPR